MTTFLTIRKPNSTDVYPAGWLEINLNRAGAKFMKSYPVKQHDRLFEEKVCVYCKSDDLPANGVGDHVVRKDPNEFVDMDPYRVPSCKSCNCYEKNQTDLLEWWLEKKNRDCFDLDWRVIGIYVRAQWTFRDFYSLNPTASAIGILDEPISDSFKKALEQLFKRIQTEKLNDENYQTRVKQIIFSFCENVHSIDDPALARAV
jgi:hypothetical protein